MPLSPSFLEDGRRLAAHRRTLMQDLIRKDPARALEQSLRWSEWTALPSDIRAMVEQPFSERVDLDVIVGLCPPGEGQQPSWTRRLALHGTELEAFVYGQRNTMTSKIGIPAQGIMLGGMAALWEDPVQRVDGEDLAAVRTRFPQGNPPGQSWLTGLPVRGEGLAGLVGGRLYSFASEQEMARVTQAIREAEQRPGPHTVQSAMAVATDSGAFDVPGFMSVVAAAQSQWTETPKYALCVRLDYTPPLGTAYTYEQFMDYMDQASTVIRDMSYGKAWIIPTVTTQVLVLPHSKAEYDDPNDPNVQAPNDRTTVARSLAAAAGYDSNDYDVLVESIPDGYGGVSSIGRGHVTLFGPAAPDVIVHEFGHVYGLKHANTWCDQTGTGLVGHLQSDGLLIEHDEYGDLYDIMGVGYNTPAWADRHMNVNLKAALNWIEPEEVVTADADGVYRIYRFDHPAARTDPNATLALRVFTRDGEEFWISLREAFAPNPLLQRSACIVWTPDGPSMHRLLDTRPLSVPNGTQDLADCALPVGLSWTDPTRSFRITNLGAGGITPFDYLDLEVAHLPDQDLFELYTDTMAATPGLVASFVDKSLRATAVQDDWRVSQKIVGARVDPNLYFLSNCWGARASVGLTHGTDANWDNFSVQWDGILLVKRPARFATKSNDASRMWIDLNQDGVFAPSGLEFMDNQWGRGHAMSVGPFSPTVKPGAYPIRIQYEEGTGDNGFALVACPVQFEFFADSALSSAGITASYVDQSLRKYTRQDDWRVTQKIAGSRMESYPGHPASDWGGHGALRLTHGTSADWDQFSAQWDGFLAVYQPMVFATASNDSSRMWMDLDGDGAFSAAGPEFIDNHWGQAQPRTYSRNSDVVAPGTYHIRIQYEEGTGANTFMFCGACAPLSGDK